MSAAPAYQVNLIFRAYHWMGIEEALETAAVRGVFRPPLWVQEWYWPEFQGWVKKFEPPDEDERTGKKPPRYERDPATGEFPWAMWLQVSPVWDLWMAVEEVVYGETVTDEYRDYKQRRERRR